MLKNGSLTGIKVIDLSRLLPGPYCTMILADHGARVIAIEDRRFLADGLFLNTVNRNKEHITLNLKSEQGKKIFFELVKDADVVVEGFRPGVVEKLGVDYRTVAEKNPGIVYCSISGYGQTGEYRDRSGHDVNYLALCGVLDLIGDRDRPPAIPGVQFADIAGGGMSAAIGILLALVARQTTGKGQYIDISMTDSMLAFLPTALFMYHAVGVFPERANALLSHRYAFYNIYETKDGRHISIGALEHRFWKNLCAHLGLDAFIVLQYDEARRQEIIDTLRDVFRSKTLEEWKADLAGVDCCWAPVQSVAEVLDDPFFAHREMVVASGDPDARKAKTIGVPVKLSDTPGRVRTVPDEFGQSTVAVLGELGYTKEQIETFFKDGVV
ncbi:MAG: CaiB/BaiF CoA-transferase family protein [Thermodesulfobacteriota bacterium]|nr:CaiB/BaiF CoA-transferase family protein [Thermodesulfobacteriota bacterium]